MVSVVEARKIIASNCVLQPMMKMSLDDAVGLILAENVYSSYDVPSFDNSAMDGFAVKLSDSISSYKIVGSIQAGKSELQSLENGEAVHIYTGAPLPPGADAVIQSEISVVENGHLSFNSESIKPGTNIRRKGDQSRQGNLVACAGHKITPGMIGLFASVGINNILVYAPVSVGVITTGNELQDVGKPLEDYRIYNSNAPAVKAYLKSLGVNNAEFINAGDDLTVIKEKISYCLGKYDMLILTGGISVGDYDFVKEALFSNGVKELFYKIKQKPGKPLFAGRKDNKIIFALPGNPAAVISCFNQYVKPCIKSIMGFADTWKPNAILPLKESYTKKSGLTHFLKARRENDHVILLRGQESFNLLAFSEADCIVEIPEEKEIVNTGEKVRVYEW